MFCVLIRIAFDSNEYTQHIGISLNIEKTSLNDPPSASGPGANPQWLELPMS